MKFLIDNCLSQRLAKAIDALDQDHTIAHLKDEFPENADDPVWLETLPQRGYNAVVGGDLFRDPPAQAALLRSGLTVFMLAKGWVNIPLWEQAWKLVRWWPEIRQQAVRIEAGACFEIPVKVTGKFKLFRPPMKNDGRVE